MRTLHVLLLALCTSCSATFVVEAPARVRPGDRPPCTRDERWPYADLVLAGVSAAAGIGVATGIIDERDGEDGMKVPLTQEERVGIPLASLLYAGFLGWSSYWGFQETKQCRALDTISH